MGIGFVILLWAIVGIFLLASYFGLATLAHGTPRAKLLKKVFVAAVAAVVFPVAALVAFSFVAGFFPGHVFQTTFGFSPPPDVSELEGRKVVFGDGGEAYLRFKAGKQTVERILDQRFREDAGALPGSFDQSTPDYWKPVPTASTRYFRADHFDDSFGASQAVLIYDEATGIVHFCWWGID